MTSRRTAAHHALRGRLASYVNGPDAPTATKALACLGQKLAAAGSHQTVRLLGGGALWLGGATSARRGDLRAVLAFAGDVASEVNQLPNDWLHSSFDPQLMTMRVDPDADFPQGVQYPGLDVRFARPELLLAQACFKAVPGDGLTPLVGLMAQVPVLSLDHLYDIVEHYGSVDMVANGEADGDRFLEDLAKAALHR